MTSDTRLKIVTTLFTTIAILAVGACTAVGLSETTTSQDSANEPTVVPTPTEEANEATPTETPTPEPADTPTPVSTSTPTPEPDDTPTPAPDGDDDDASGSDSQESSEDAEANSAENETASSEQDEQDGEPAEPGRPVELRIDKLGVDAPFEWVGLTPEGNMAAPEGWDNIAWYEPGPAPGEQGNSVIAGHYDRPGGSAAVFYELRSLVPGDRITIRTEHDEELVFEVTEVERVHVSEAPLQRIFGDTDQHNMNLITCEGAWDPSANMYDQRLIVYTTLVSG